MLNQSLEALNLPNTTWEEQPDPAELAALEDIRQAGWFDRESPILVSLLDLVEAVSAVSENEDEVLATVAYMLESGSVALRGEGPQADSLLH
ncbi:MAG: hypothetical protein P8M78_12840 [Myxococcota bacterium]|jgi:hypothetical protein|nr:hypothetical protein [Myxococcota bacterium]